MGKQTHKRTNFIKLYRRKLQHELNDMGYPGSKETADDGRAIDGSIGVVIDAGKSMPKTHSVPARRST